MSFEWRRPKGSIPYPKVWMEFEAKESKDSDKLVKYCIQDVPEDRFEEAVQFYCDTYIPDEPMVQTIGMFIVKTKRKSFLIHFCCLPRLLRIDAANDQGYIDDTKYFQREIAKEKLTLICVREGSDEIVGVNFLIVCSKNDTFIQEASKNVNGTNFSWKMSGIFYNFFRQLKSKGFIDQMRVFGFVSSQFCPFEKYGVDKMLASTGITVARKYRELGIGTKFYECRWQIGYIITLFGPLKPSTWSIILNIFSYRKRVAAAFDIKILNAHFSSDYSSKCAEKAGFREDLYFTWEELRDKIPDLAFSGVESKGYFVKTWVS